MYRPSVGKFFSTLASGPKFFANTDSGARRTQSERGKPLSSDSQNPLVWTNELDARRSPFFFVCGEADECSTFSIASPARLALFLFVLIVDRILDSRASLL